MTDTTRRRLIASIGSGLTISIAGCSGDSAGGESGSSSDDSGRSDDGLLGGGSNVFDGFTFEEYTLNVSLSTTEGFDKIAVFNSDDEEFASTSVTASAGQVSLDFSGYTPGEHRFAAINSDDGSVVSETTESLEPNLDLVNWQTASEAGMYSPDDDSSISDIVTEIENTGNAPVKLAWVGYQAPPFTPNWSEGEEVKQAGGIEGAAPEVQAESISEDGQPEYIPDLKSGRELPLSVYPGEQMQLVDASNYRYLVAGLECDRSIVPTDDTEGWTVQEGIQYEFTVTLDDSHGKQSSVTKTVTWENVGTSCNLTSQPADALISTERVGGSS